jgi:hypothetical protein
VDQAKRVTEMVNTGTVSSGKINDLVAEIASAGKEVTNGMVQITATMRHIPI